MYFHGAFSNIGDVPRELAVIFGSDWIIKLNLVNAGSNCIEIELLPALVLVKRRNAVSVGHVGCKVVHQFQNPACPNVGVVKLDHLRSKILVLLKRKSQGVITVGWCRPVCYLLKPIG